MNPPRTIPPTKKPEGFDNIPKQIPDPEAEKPEDWDDEADGQWEAPLISNPEFKGDWKPKKIPNPAYKGAWVHPEIDNPAFIEDKNIYRFSDIGSVGIDIWQVKAGTIFDNILISDSVSEAEAFLAETYTAKKDKEKEAFDAYEKKKKDEEEAARKANEASKPAEAEDTGDDDDDAETHPHEDL
jgi:calreticulin